MKKLNLMIATLFVASIMFSCQKETNGQFSPLSSTKSNNISAKESTQSNAIAAEQNTKTKNDKRNGNGEMKWDVPLSGIANDILAVIKINEENPGEYNGKILHISPKKNSKHDAVQLYVFHVTPGNNGGVGGTQNPPAQVVCQGSGLSFARCCQGYFDAHPNGCLQITYDSNSGDYTADDNC